MSKCNGKNVKADPKDPCCPPEPLCGSVKKAACSGPAVRFAEMIPNCLKYAEDAKSNGRPVVGIMCEYAPREIIMAAGGVPVCLCGGSSNTIHAAEEDLPSNLCPLIKSTYGYHVRRSNPFIEMADLIVAETTCDGKKKMFEIMADSRPTYVLELPQKEDDADSKAHWTTELEKFRGCIEGMFMRAVRDEDLRGAIGIMNRERALRRRLAELMKEDCPPLTGRQLLDLKSSISGIPDDLEAYDECLEHYSSVPRCPEMKNRVRVLLTGVPVVHGAERVFDIIENSGGLVVCQENCTGLKPILEDVDETAHDPMEALAEKYYSIPCSVKTRNEKRIDIIRQLAAEYRAECIIDLVWQACLTYDIESYRVRRLAEEELGIPFLRIETDYSPSDSARIAVRVEALYETVRVRD